MSRTCRNCNRVIKRGHWCSAIACHAKGQRQSEVDAAALARNPRWLAPRAEDTKKTVTFDPPTFVIDGGGA